MANISLCSNYELFCDANWNDKKGRAPLVKYSNGKYYSMELHHINEMALTLAVNQ